MEIAIAIAVVVGIVVLVLGPAAKAYQRSRSAQDQGKQVDPDEIPPLLPDEPVPGSRPHRRRHGQP